MPIMLSFAALVVIGVVLAGINAASVRDKGDKISKKAIYAGLSLAIILVVWRLLMSVARI
jgi:hypothetical protein